MRFVAFLIFSVLGLGTFCAAAQPPQQIHRIGLLSPGSEVPLDFSRSLSELGYVVGKTIFIEIRNAGGKAENLPKLVIDLLDRKVSLIVASGPTAIGAAAKATQSIPIVMVGGGDPVLRGFVKHLSAPGGNVTGSSSSASGSDAKRLELLKESLPSLARVVVLNPLSRSRIPEGYPRAAKEFGIDFHIVDLRSVTELESALARVKALRPEAFITIRELITVDQAERIATFGLRERVPSMYESAEFVRAGGLMSYGVNRASQWLRAAVFVDKILKGANPATLPVEPPQLEMVINLRTAKQLGVTIPPEILLEANEVIK